MDLVQPRSAEIPCVQRLPDESSVADCGKQIRRNTTSRSGSRIAMCSRVDLAQCQSAAKFSERHRPRYRHHMGEASAPSMHSKRSRAASIRQARGVILSLIGYRARRRHRPVAPMPRADNQSSYRNRADSCCRAAASGERADATGGRHAAPAAEGPTSASRATVKIAGTSAGDTGTDMDARHISSPDPPPHTGCGRPSWLRTAHSRRGRAAACSRGVRHAARRLC